MKSFEYFAVIKVLKLLVEYIESSILYTKRLNPHFVQGYIQG